MIFPRLCLIFFKYAQPFLISRVISFVSDPVTSGSHEAGYVLIAAAAFVYIGAAIGDAQYQHRLYRTNTMLRGALVGLIYDRTLLIQDGVYDESAAITLMSTDVDGINGTIERLFEVWAPFLEVAIGIYLLANELGWVCIIPILVVALCTIGSTWIAKLVQPRQRLWTAASQKRLAMTSSMLGDMKSVKMMGLAETLATSIQDQRLRELELARSFRSLIVTMNMNANAPAIFAPVLTFVAYAIQAKLNGSTSLSTNQAFTSLAIIALLTVPAGKLLYAMPIISAAMANFRRVQEFLLAPSWNDERYETNPFSPGIEASAISVVSATICPSPTSDPALVDITVKLVPSTINILVGPVGSGKSTLMKAILGELPCKSGQISVSSKTMSYCAQRPWLLNISIQQSICGLNNKLAIDQEWYRSVVYACVLDEDMLQFPEGDQSVIGSRGLTLSGGQKQRVALARTVYARRDTVLLDDVLSALDSKTEQLVVDRLLGAEGLFRKLGTTVLLITHTTRHFHLVNHIMVLGTDGQMAQQGEFEDLRNQKGYINSLVLQSSHSADETSTSVIEDLQKKPFPEAKKDDLMDLTRKTGDFAVYGFYFRSVGLFSALGCLGCVIVSTFMGTFPRIWLKWWTDDNGAHIAKYLSVYIVLSLGATVFQGLTISLFFVRMGPKASTRLHHALLQTVMTAPQSFFSETDTGVTVNRFSQDMQQIDRNLPVSCMMTTTQGFRVLATAAFTSLGSTYVATSIPFFLVAIYMLQKVYLRTSRQLRYLDLEAKSPVYSHFLESLDGLATIRAFSWQDESRETNVQRLDASQAPFYLLYCIQVWLYLVLDLIVAAMAVFVVTMAVELRSTTNPGLIGVALFSVLGFSQNLAAFVDAWTMLETSLGAVARLKTFQETTVSENKPGEDKVPLEEWPEKGALDFRNVTASYGSEISLVIQCCFRMLNVS